MDLIVEVRAEYREAIAEAVRPMPDEIARLREQIAELRGQMTMLVALINGGENKTIDVSEVIRKIQVSP